jgi:acetyl esterase/lipase
MKFASAREQFPRFATLKPTMFLRALTLITLSLISCLNGGESETLVYKEANGRKLRLFIDKPADWKPSDKRPAMIFFFGGGWVGGTPDQFKKQAAYFATRGMVTARVDYRTIPAKKGPPDVCCADAKSAIRHLRTHAAKLGVDPSRIAGAGGSAGGHLAAFAALVPGLDDPKDDLNVSCKPDALVLFNPVFDNGPGQWGNDRLGANFRAYSPAHHISKGAPPTIIFLGDSDKLIPVKVGENFTAKMKEVGSRCELRITKGAGHGFFNNSPHFEETVVAADEFLESLGWIKGTPTLK